MYRGPDADSPAELESQFILRLPPVCSAFYTLGSNPALLPFAGSSQSSSRSNSK